MTPWLILRFLTVLALCGAAVALVGTHQHEERMQRVNVQTCFGINLEVTPFCQRSDPHAWHNIGVLWQQDI